MSPLFPSLPVEFTHLKAAAARCKRSGEGVDAPESVADIAGRLRRLLDAVRDQDYAGLSSRDFARLPYALWLEGHAFLGVDHPRMVERYWQVHLPEALRADVSGHALWLMPLLHTYIHQFSPSDASFREFAYRLARAMPTSTHSIAMTWSELQKRIQALNPEQAASGFARYFFDTTDRDVATMVAALHLGLGMQKSRLGHAVVEAGLLLPLADRRKEHVALRVLSAIEHAGIEVTASERWRIPVADGLLSPWDGTKMPASVSWRTYEFFERHYGAVPETQPGQLFSGQPGHWRGVSEAAIRVMRYWQMGDQIRLFMKLIEKTADEIWRYRQKFWMAYYENNLIDDVRLILGPDAQLMSRAPEFRALAKNFGRLSGAARNQSVIVFKIGDLILVEGSHNRSLRAFFERDDAINARRFFKNGLVDSVTLNIRSLDFHGGENIKPELPHLHSETGWWQKKARNLIKHHTGANLPEWEILL